MNKSLITLIALIFASAAWGRGGEIGNARYVAYDNKILGYETRVPKDWNRFSLGEAMSFVENGLPGSIASVVNLNSEQFTEIKTVEDLRRRLTFFHPLKKWEPIALADREGFISADEHEGIIYLLRSEATVVSIRFRARSDEQARQDVDTILQSLKFR